MTDRQQQILEHFKEHGATYIAAWLRVAGPTAIETEQDPEKLFDQAITIAWVASMKHTAKCCEMASDSPTCKGK